MANNEGFTVAAPFFLNSQASSVLFYHKVSKLDHSTLYIQKLDKILLTLFVTPVYV